MAIQNKTKKQFVILGDRHYYVERPWPHSDVNLAGLSDVVAFPDGRVAAICRNAPHVVIFGTGGEVVDTWVIPTLVCPHYGSITKNGDLLIADLDGHRIFRINAQGVTVNILGRADYPRWGAPFNHPTAAVEDKDGGYWVSDGYGNSCVHHFAADLTLTSTFGVPGAAPGELSTPHDVLVARNGQLLAVDRENHRVQVFNADGSYCTALEQLYKPMAVAQLSDGSILVTDHTPRLSRYTVDGQLLGRCRTFSTVAHGLAVAPDGCIYLAEMAPTMLTRLCPVNDGSIAI
ncbi:MAG: peptidylglycine monooxygenase [Burkholderiaceae bacterium]|nr:peptidylglycine monooxygenase [Burkholderiaceae bacterium]